MFRRNAAILLAGVSALVAIVVYLNALRNGFTLDDRGIIVDNPLVHSLSGVWRGFAHSYWPDALEGGQYRPLVIATFALDWAISGGSPFITHAGNLLLHALATLAVFRLARELLSPAGAFTAALLFAVHPVHVEAVANAVGRAELLVAALVILAVLAHRRASWAAPIAFALALLAKENGVVFLGLALASDVMLESEPLAALKARRQLYMAYGGITVIYAAVLWTVFHGRQFVVVAPTWTGATVTERWLTMAAVVPHYVRLLIAPVDLSVDYTPRVIDLAHGLSLTGAAGLAIVVVAIAAVVTLRRREPVIAFAIVLFAVTIAPVANIVFPSGVVLAERTMYLPSVAIALIAGQIVERTALSHVWRTTLAVILVLSAFALRTWTRTPVWRDNKTLTLTVLEDHPESYRAHFFAGRVLLLAGNPEVAWREFARARELFPNDPGLYRASAEAAMDLRRFDMAIAMLDSAIARIPNYGIGWLRRADARFLAGDMRGAWHDALVAQRLLPDSSRWAVIAARAAQQIGAPATADSIYRAAIAKHRGAWELHAGRALLLLDQADTATAISEIRAARSLAPGNDVVMTLGRRVGLHMEGPK